MRSAFCHGVECAVFALTRECTWSIDGCHGLLMYAYTCVDGWSPGYTCKGIMSEWMRGCVGAWVGGGVVN